MYTIKIAIATNINFYKSTLPIVISSLIEQGIERDNIHVFNAGFDRYDYQVIDGIHYHRLDHNSYEYSPLIEIVDKQLESEYWFVRCLEHSILQ